MRDEDRSMWDRILEQVREARPELTRHWFDALEPVSLESGVLTVHAPTSAQASYLSRECVRPFTDAAQNVTGRLVSVRFVNGAERRERSSPILAELKPTRPEPSAVREAGDARLDDLPLNPDCTFDTFVVGPNNRLAHAAALAIADNPGQTYNPLFVHGGVGLGKTHLLQAVCQRVLERDPYARILYISCEGFITRFIECVRDGRMDEFRHQFRETDLLVLDDVHFLAKRDRTQDEFFHTFNRLHQSRRQIVLSSDAPPEQIPDLEQRLVSRFQSGLVSPIEPPAFETRVEIVQNKAFVRGQRVPDDVAQFIASRFDSNIRELEGALTKVVMVAGVDKREIDLSLAREALGDAPARSQPMVSMDAIVDEVCGYYEVSRSALLARNRQRSIVLPRQVAMHLCRNHTGYSLGEIGAHFGGRDHTTVIHAVRRIEADRETDDSIGQALREIERSLLSGA